ncbi:unnamed protein product [Thelazia callipaeda]|uniref:Uncharacterized protein n=1 Tax=Thelazia callipaeda TaxID=103827 RepID=A0A0N5D1T4_THECL|nr:unnamed protein product [Thelazia callipaeda]
MKGTDNDRETDKIFIFGLLMLLAWMLVVLICTSPKFALIVYE